MSKTLLQQLREQGVTSGEIEASLGDIESLGYMTRNKDQECTATKLGKAVVASGLDAEDGVFIHGELKKALRSLVLDGDMHVLYIFTPISESFGQVNWQIFRNEMEAMDASDLRVLSHLGIKPGMINKLYVV